MKSVWALTAVIAALLVIAGGVYLASVSRSGERTGPPFAVSSDAPKPALSADAFPRPPRPVRLLFVGDIMLDRGVRLHVERVAEGAGNPSFSFAKIADYLRSFDLVVANLEGPVSDAGERVGSIYSFRMNPDVVPALVAANIRAVNFANNHVWDYGRQAFEDTLARLSVAGIGYFGAGRNAAEAYAPYVLEREGIKIAFVGFTEFLRQVEATNERSGIAFADPETVRAAIIQARQQADIVIVSFHMGEEYRPEPMERQRTLARLAVDAGADLVVGHHPHVIESHESYRGKEIFYSLGNFVFDQSFSTSTMTAGLLEVDIAGGSIVRTNLRQGTINRNFQPSPPEAFREGGPLPPVAKHGSF
ncbi:MAG: CapA family protein [bacterium]|nr:CapA family protein [bacterium]